MLDVILKTSLTLFFLSLVLELVSSRPHQLNHRHPPDGFNSGSTRILFMPNNETAYGGSEDFFIGEQDIIFPGSEEDISELKKEVGRAPGCPEGQVFCENIDTYPYQQLKQILRSAPLNKAYFGIDEVPPAEIANRIGEPEESFFCTSVEKTIFPKVGKNKNNKWKYIINAEADGYIQGIRVEVCSKPDGPCDLIGDAPAGYIIKCKQKYIYRRLLSLSDEGRAIPDTFQVPSACCCSYKRDQTYLVSFGRT